MPQILKENFFDRPSLEVARDLLGKNLARKLKSEIVRLPVLEVEAYVGFEDKASHAHRGPTPRNQVMFGPAGYFYVYLCYGVHWLLNIVTEEAGKPAALLIRGAGPYLGPGKLPRALAIDKTHDSRRASPACGLWFEDPGEPLPGKIRRTPRIGVDYAGKIWAGKPYRFVLTPRAVKN